MAKILVVDDDDTLRGLIRALLERRNHCVTEARDGDAGLEDLGVTRGVHQRLEAIITAYLSSEHLLHPEIVDPQI